MSSPRVQVAKFPWIEDLTQFKRWMHLTASTRCMLLQVHHLKKAFPQKQDDKPPRPRRYESSNNPSRDRETINRPQATKTIRTNHVAHTLRNAYTHRNSDVTMPIFWIMHTTSRAALFPYGRRLRNPELKHPDFQNREHQDCLN
ncbi:hypothetical protein T4E_1359 [Trichinella pseudospiralis]|uniref:Uncharacterized protein n=1 Tax=Trichinella pseudospiralis TaxID=6337 RepID=A0A0V0YNV5_TRIPS|nr:hypothetical protein T4E_1359 [Trichinella pseudospiralis]